MSGHAAPLGATFARGGVNFSLYSRHATGVELCFFDALDDARPARAEPLERTGDYWHARVEWVLPGQLYGYRVDGPFAPELGLRFDPQKLLLDPYGRGVAVPRAYGREAARRPGDTCA